MGVVGKQLPHQPFIRSDIQREAPWVMRLWINLWTRAPHRMETKVSIIAWMHD